MKIILLTPLFGRFSVQMNKKDGVPDIRVPLNIGPLPPIQFLTLIQIHTTTSIIYMDKENLVAVRDIFSLIIV